MLRALELLAPARNADIGIAAIDCGADAVYIAGPGFGARHSAGNPVDEVRRLCEYAHRFGARIFVTLNTILYDGELPEARALMRDLEDAGADAFIVQDLAVRSFGARVPLHASTQCSIRTPEDAAFYSGMGFSRLVLERQLSLEDIRKIHSATPAELEFFVHGALCVCYSGQCYMSEAVAGRSANRGECVQACRSLYDLVDSSGRTLVRNKALLSLKDLNLSNRMADLADAGISSFKIEGRLKNISYVRNVTREYSMALDALVAS
ncbi:MAG: U32 family peptidase, partial [Bacteroidales bacterium]|nr:U32 family peptidase [Bacteroidales bacterium]